MLRGSSGLSHKQARRQIATAETLGRLPAVREAVEASKITFGNAGVLAEAERKTSAEDVQTDPGLLAQAQQMPEDQFARQARSWAAKRQRDHGEADFAQLRKQRFMRVWDGDDGMTHLKAAFDPVAGQRIRRRLEHLAARFHKNDKKHATKTRLANNGQRHNPQNRTPTNAQNTRIPGHHNNKPGSTSNTTRSFEQCRADALEQLLTNNTRGSSSGAPSGTRNTNTSSSGSSGSGSGGDIRSGSIRNGSTSDNNKARGGSSAPSGTRNTNTSSSGSSGSGSGGDIRIGSIRNGSTSDNNKASGGSSAPSSGGCGSCGGGVSPPVADILVYADISTMQPEDSGGLAAAGQRSSVGNTVWADTNAAEGSGNGSTAPPGVATRPVQAVPDAWCSGNGSIAQPGAATGAPGGFTVEGNSSSSRCAAGAAGVPSGGLAAEIAGGGPVPPSVLERLLCNARITGLLFNGPGLPLWYGRSRRTATTAQLKALRLRDRSCVGCGAHPDTCQAHHIVPYSQGGNTDIGNLVLVCYTCHHRIHENNWQITTTPNGQHNLQPPNPTNHHTTTAAITAAAQHHHQNTTSHHTTTEQQNTTERRSWNTPKRRNTTEHRNRHPEPQHPSTTTPHPDRTLPLLC